MKNQLPQCGFGETGLCCRHCLQGPCRIDPFGVSGPKFGICGVNADVGGHFATNEAEPIEPNHRNIWGNRTIVHKRHRRYDHYY